MHLQGLFLFPPGGIFTSEHHIPRRTLCTLAMGGIHLAKVPLHPEENVPDIYKIGSTNTTVSERIRNAVNEPTYLYAGVDIVDTYRCFNIQARELEDRLHTFFDNVRLNINIPDENGAVISPREWFCVGLDVINEAVKRILLGTIQDYIYDPESKAIIAKNATVKEVTVSAGEIAPFANATHVSIENFNNQGVYNDFSGASLFFPGKSDIGDTVPKIE